jgi:hypothetical protein
VDFFESRIELTLENYQAARDRFFLFGTILPLRLAKKPHFALLGDATTTSQRTGKGKIPHFSAY